MGCGFVSFGKSNKKSEFLCWDEKDNWKEPVNDYFLNIAKKSHDSAKEVISQVDRVINKYNYNKKGQSSPDEAKPYIGIGISLNDVNDIYYPIVAKINTNGPAYRAGLRNGDWVSKINSKYTYNEKVITVAKWFNKELGDANSMRYFDVSQKLWKNVTLYNEKINHQK